MDDLQPGDGQPLGLDPPRPFNPLPQEVSDQLAAYAMVERQLPRDPNAPPRASHEALGRVDCPFRPVEDCRRMFGAGTYRLTFFDEGHKYQGRAYVTVAAPAESRETPVQTVQNTGAPAYVPPSNEAPPWAQVLVSRLDALERERQAQPRGMTMEDMRTVLELARGMAPPPQDATHVDSVARAFRQGMSLAREVFDRSAPAADNSIGGIIRDALPGVLQAVQQMQSNGAAPAAPALVATPAPKDAIVTPSWVMPMVNELNRAMRAQDDPAYTADWLERNVPGEILTQLRGEETAVVASLKGYGKAVPGLLTPEGEQFVRGVLRELRGEDEGEGEQPAATGEQ